MTNLRLGSVSFPERMLLRSSGLELINLISIIPLTRGFSVKLFFRPQIPGSLCLSGNGRKTAAGSSFKEGETCCLTTWYVWWLLWRLFQAGTNQGKGPTGTNSHKSVQTSLEHVWGPRIVSMARKLASTVLGEMQLVKMFTCSIFDARWHRLLSLIP